VDLAGALIALLFCPVCLCCCQIGVWYTAACASLCLLLPLVLASFLLLLATLLWATVSCSSIAMTPCVSRFGLAAWIALQLWFYSGGQLLQGAKEHDKCMMTTSCWSW
jgi:hypothetical protein